jgi:hypothetical protein
MLGTSVPPGSYYLLLQANADAAFVESDGNNNRVAVLIVVSRSVVAKPDLVLTALSIPSVLTGGRSSP